MYAYRNKRMATCSSPPGRTAALASFFYAFVWMAALRAVLQQRLRLLAISAWEEHVPATIKALCGLQG
jgi:hypothetical protein